MQRAGLNVARRLARSPTLARSYSTQSASTSSSVRRNGIISIALLAAAAGAYYYEQQSSKSTTTTIDGRSINLTSQFGRTFTVPRPGKPGKVETFVRKSHQEIEAMLHANEDGQVVGRKGNPVVKWDRNWVGSNEPCEDRSAIDIVPRSRGASDGKSSVARVEGDRDISLFSIIDGHAGDATSKLLARTLHPSIALSLAGLQAAQATWNPMTWVGGNKWNSSSITKSIRNAYVTLDENICQTPVRMFPTLSATAAATFPTPTQTFVAISGPAEAGACAISTVVDAENDDLYVALAGDCRVVAGWQDANGKWRCDVLSEDQMGENPQEVERLRAEHPREKDTVIMRGRVMGGLQPTRAFGDAIYKWTSDQANKIHAAFKAEGLKTRKQNPAHATPPYVTAEPVVTHRKLKANGEMLRFVVMATDGLWDRITSEESTLLVASYLNHPTHEDVSKVELANQVPLTPSAGERPYPSQDLPGSGSRAEGTWVFEGDKNAATHLIRNSLAGGDRKLQGELLSMNGGVTRWFRDDITVTVVFFGDERFLGDFGDGMHLIPS